MADEEQIMPENPEVLLLGQQAKEFKSSDFGRYLFDQAAMKAGEAAKQLCDVDPNDTKTIIKLQMQAKTLSNLNEFINKAIYAADAEYEAYKQNVEGGD